MIEKCACMNRYAPLAQVRVSCACYSEYLSSRDYSSLEFLFNALDVQAYISYRTLVKLCEEEINMKVNIRETVAAVITGEQSSTAVAQGNGSSGSLGACPRVLLVDEVDVFFTKDFYGSFYNPAVDLRHDKISELIQKIWDAGSSAELSMETVKGWTVYSQLCAVYPSWTSLIDASISHMIHDLSEFAGHVYEVLDGRIGYREQDGISFNVSDGYLTIFANIKENKAGRVSEIEMQKNLKLLVQCGHFLFAKLPSKFNLVLGVTGTLETLTGIEKDIVCNDYQIKRFVIMPSVYGTNPVKMLGISTVSSADAFRLRLIEEIERYNSRAVIAFFESKESLVTFWRSDDFKMHAESGRLHVLLEEMRTDEKQQIVSCRSGAARAITLATRPFGRGTDFAAMDESVNKAGGIHVISSFLAGTESEEIQIKGRTARQGEQGSFSMVLLQERLQRFGVEDAKIDEVVRSGTSPEDSSAKLWNLLNRQRQALCETECKGHVEFVKENEKLHAEAMAFTEALQRGDAARVTDFLRAQNPPAQAKRAHGKARILVLMDATGSMGNAMRAAKDTIGVMFDRATQILADFAGGGSDLFEMQFAVYRNYSSGPDLLLEASEWRSNPQDLKDFLGRVNASGGQGNEAVEIGLWHANAQEDLKQVATRRA